ncbi:MAG TPA: hypothetical protein VEW07_15170 [Solirubrobacterales bacterium]|nr:hypothetical protein [Solirubrobacterales bacterium]
MSRIVIAIAVASLVIGVGNALANDPPDFGEDMRVAQVAWKPLRVLDANTIAIHGPRVTFCNNQPTLETSVTEERSRVVVNAYVVRPTGPELKCLRREVLKATVDLTYRLNGRPLYDGVFSPPRLRPLPLVPERRPLSNGRDPDGYRIELIGE